VHLNGAENLPTVGILYPGEMGAALGRALIGNGIRVVATLEGRSERTRFLCGQAGLEVLPSLDEVVRRAGVVVSVVPPAAAVSMARQYARLAATVPKGALYVDVNAVSPATAVEIGQILAAAGVDYVDAAINGLASALHSGAMVYLSGTRAAELERLLGRTLPVQVVGDEPGKASALKGALAGLSKGMTALFVEIALMARAAGVSGFFMERCWSYYPGVMEVVDRMLPTYPRHAGRRAEEMGELEAAIAAVGLQSQMVRAARQVTHLMAEADLGQHPGELPWTADRVLEALRSSGAFRMQPAVETHS
jgi:3-hydroxyisobutyrate dehydrogenase-like beta-hydroxyacid dehydrogenase